MHAFIGNHYYIKKKVLSFILGLASIKAENSHCHYVLDVSHTRKSAVNSQ